MRDKMKKETINTLDEINKGTCMGMDAVHFTLEKVKNAKLKAVLHKMYADYEAIEEEITKIYPKYNESEPHETSLMNKAMTWYGIEMKTMLDDSNYNIAELLLKGVNMGVIEGRKILNHKKIAADVKKIVEKYVNMQERAVEELKKYL